MDKDLAQPVNSTRLKRDLSRDAISLALAGEWERAVGVNRAILELFGQDVGAMNRLSKALMETGRLDEAKDVLREVANIAPYNTIAKKNLARLDSLNGSPISTKQGRKTGVVPQLFIEESGKSGTTVLRKTGLRETIARAAPSDRVNLVIENNAMSVYSREGEYLGQVEPKLGQRLVRLTCGGNEYDAAVITISEQGISIIIRETFRHHSLQDVCSFPSKTKEEHRVYWRESIAHYIRDDGLDEEDEEENIIDEEEMETEWNDGE